MTSGPAKRAVKPRPAWPQVLSAIAAAAAAGMLALSGVAAARFIVDFDAFAPFFERYPGTYPAPDWAPTGVTGWAAWTHFLNSFFLILLVRTGIIARQQKQSGKRPRAFWVSTKNKRKRMPLNIHTHLVTDIAWLANGVIFVVLLFATGHWTRIVPTSWEVFPNALSAFMQYASLDWPVHDSWTGYNAMQQLSYFAIVFIVAPLAAITGWRLSTLWPKNNETLDKLVPYQTAERWHYPVMLVFIGFVIVHVGLVLLTGWQANLNHMFAASAATTGAAAWAGTVMFALALVAFVIGWRLAASPAFGRWLGKRTGDVLER